MPFVVLVVAVDGGFTEWSSWSDCSVSCGDGKRSRSRNCTNPEPSCGGKDCVGIVKEVVDCVGNGGPVGKSSKSQKLILRSVDLCILFYLV